MDKRTAHPQFATGTPHTRRGRISAWLIRSTLEAAALLVVAGVTATAASQIVPIARTPSAEAQPAHGSLQPDRFQGVLWVDARAAASFAQAHIPEAINLNKDNWDQGLGELFAAWTPPRRIVVYCSKGCDSARQIADRLIEMGIEPVEVFEGGFESWKEAST